MPLPRLKHLFQKALGRLDFEISRLDNLLSLFINCDAITAACFCAPKFTKTQVISATSLLDRSVINKLFPKCSYNVHFIHIIPQSFTYD